MTLPEDAVVATGIARLESTLVEIGTGTTVMVDRITTGPEAVDDDS